jgi:hypothetical protein
MTEIYMHELGGESSEDLLLAYGFDVRKSNTTTTNDKGEEVLSSLQPKTCPYCSEPNKPTSKFCISTARWC